MSLLRPLALVAALALSTAAYSAVFSVSQQSLSVGTTFQVNGTEFGPKPTAWLEFGAKRIPLKVLKGATDTQFTAQVKNIPRNANGECLLRVRPRGVRVPFAFAGMVLELPRPEGVEPASAPAGQEVTISGTFFGTKKPKVRFETRSAKVVSYGDTEIVVRVPDGLSPGLQRIYVQSAAGQGEQGVMFTVSN